MNEIAAKPRHRPRAVTWVAMLHMVQGLILLPIGLLVLIGLAVEISDGGYVFNGEALVYGSLIVFYGLLSFPIAFGLLGLKSWAWTAAMMLQGLQLASALIQSYFGDNDYLTLAMASFIVLCLNQQEVRVAFGVGRPRDAR